MHKCVSILVIKNKTNRNSLKNFEMFENIVGRDVKFIAKKSYKINSPGVVSVLGVFGVPGMSKTSSLNEVFKDVGLTTLF